MSKVLVSLEGDLNGETANIVGSTTVDGTVSLLSDFIVETGRPDNADAFKGAGVWGIVQRVYIEGQTEGQLISVSLIIDNTEVTLGTVSLPVGIKRVMEAAVQRAGWITGVRLTATGLTKRIEISSIECDVYVPQEG